MKYTGEHVNNAHTKSHLMYKPGLKVFHLFTAESFYHYPLPKRKMSGRSHLHWACNSNQKCSSIMSPGLNEWTCPHTSVPFVLIFRLCELRQSNKRAGRHPGHERLSDWHEEVESAVKTAEGCQPPLLTQPQHTWSSPTAQVTHTQSTAQH